MSAMGVTCVGCHASMIVASGRLPGREVFDCRGGTGARWFVCDDCWQRGVREPLGEAS